MKALILLFRVKAFLFLFLKELNKIFCSDGVRNMNRNKDIKYWVDRVKDIKWDFNSHMTYDSFEEVYQKLKNEGAPIEDLVSNADFMLQSYSAYSDALAFASDDLVSDMNFIISAMNICSKVVKYASKEIRADKNFMLGVIENGGNYLEFASDQLKADRDFVFFAIKKCGGALEFVDEKLKADKELVLEAIKQGGWNFEFCAEGLRQDRDFVLEVVSEDGAALEFVKNFQNDREVVLTALKSYTRPTCPMAWASEDLKSDRSFVLSAVKETGEALYYVADEFRDDREVVLEAVRSKGYAIQYASDNLLEDKTFLLHAIQINPAVEPFIIGPYDEDYELLTARELVKNVNSGVISQDEYNEKMKILEEKVKRQDNVYRSWCHKTDK